MYGDFSISIPTHDNGTWTTTDFDDKKKFIEFVFSCFKEPGKYELDETALIFNEQARLFTDQGKVYCMAPYRSRDFITYWETEKKKCRAGVIFKNKGKTWYLPRDYYMWINFLPIYDKIKKRFDFPLVWDVQIHMALYECLAELNGKHAAITKKRQIASSYFHCAKLINQLWFEEGVILKMGASLKDYINLSGSWKFLDEYKSFLNSNTAWYRPMNPGKVLEWQQQIEVTRNGRKHQKGLKGMLQGISFEQSATRGVGGPTSYFFYEEAGIAPTMRTTYEFIRPSMKMGEVVTGMFIAAGSVGELSAAEHLKEFLLYPDDNDIYAVETDLIDETGTRGRTGLFIPEQWGMPPYIDEFGNSMVKEALAALDTEFEEAKKNLSPQAYQLRISQHPRNIKEAFATRNVSTFPLALVEHQKMQIQDKMYPYELVDLDESVNGDIVVHRTNKPPVNVWPIKKDLPDKEGSIVVWERPDRDISWGKYVASIDPVGEGKTTTSESLCSIYIYKMPTHIQRTIDDRVENFIEGDKIVAAWCGRFDDINDTHKRLRLMLEWYNAQAIVENNVSLFIRYMIEQRKQRYLVPKSQILFLKEIQANKTVYQDYGWKNTGTFFSTHLLNYLIEYLKEVVEEEVDDFGTVTKKHYGIRRIPDIMAMVEMQGYDGDKNVDRLVSLTALIAYVRVLQANTEKKVVIENQIINLENSQKMSTLDRSAFRTIGKSKSMNSMNKLRSPFKRLH
jgi:hypothetical protein